MMKQARTHLVRLPARIPDDLHQSLDPLLLRRRNPLHPLLPPRRNADTHLKRRNSALPRDVDDVRLRLVPDAASRDVQHAFERGRVGGVRDQLQVGQQVLDPTRESPKRSALTASISITSEARRLQQRKEGREETDSVRSKNLCPPTIRLGTPAFCNAVSMFRLNAPYLNKIAKSLYVTSPPRCAIRCRIVEAIKVASSGALGAGCRTTEAPEGWEVVRDLLIRFVSVPGRCAQVPSAGHRVDEDYATAR